MRTYSYPEEIMSKNNTKGIIDACKMTEKWFKEIKVTS